MPKVKKIVVSASVKINLGDFDNAERGVTLEAELLSGESIEDAHTALSALATISLAYDVRQIVERQINDSWLNDMRGQAEHRIVSHVTSRPAFPYLKLLSPAMASEVIGETVRGYTSPAAPAEPEPIVGGQ